MRLYLVRHAEAAPGKPDALRPLTEDGRTAAREVGERLRAEARVDAVLTSPLLRARQTGEEIAGALGLESEPSALLAPGATHADVLAAVEGHGEIVVAIGHQPDCGLVAAALSGGEPPAFPPAGWVALDLPA